MQAQTMSQETKPVEPRWIRPSRWEKVTGMTRQQTYRALRSGQLRGVLVNRTWFIEASELSEFFERERKPAA